MGLILLTLLLFVSAYGSHQVYKSHKAKEPTNTVSLFLSICVISTPIIMIMYAFKTQRLWIVFMAPAPLIPDAWAFILCMIGKSPKVGTEEYFDLQSRGFKFSTIALAMIGTVLTIYYIVNLI